MAVLQTRILARTAQAAVACFAASVLGRFFVTATDGVSLLWPTSGVALALVLLHGPRIAPGIWIGTFLANLWNAPQGLEAAVVALANTLEPLLGYVLLRRLATFRPEMDRLQDLLGVAGCGALLAAPAGALLGNAADSALGPDFTGGFLTNFWQWWLADGLGVLVFTPLVLSWSLPAPSDSQGRRWELVAISIGLVFVSWLAFFGLPIDSYLHSSSLFFALPFLAWAGLRLPSRVANLALVWVTSAACLGVRQQGGLLVGLSEGQRIWLLALFQGVCALTVHVVCTSSSERRAVEESLRLSRAALAAKNHLLESIRRIQTRFIAGGEPRRVFEELLSEFQTLTGSEFGILGRMERDGEGQPFLKLLALSSAFRGEAPRRPSEPLEGPGFEARDLDTLSGTVLSSQRAVLTNDPAHDPRRSGLPPGHPPLRSFLGLPLHNGSLFVGMIGLANRPGGYDRELAEALEPILVTCGSLLEAHRSEERRRQAERERQDIERELAQARKLEAIGTLAGGIAHDFNNMLGAIRGNAELAMTELGPAAGAIDPVQRIVEATERASLLVRQILTFSRDRQDPREPVDLRRILQGALTLMRPALGTRIECVFEADEELPPVLGSESQLEQAALNLLTNAIQALSARGGTLRVGLRRHAVEAHDPLLLKGLELGEHVLLRVADDGPGMDANTLERIFDPYFTTKERGGGTGLGLSVVHGIVQSHRGAIRVWSRPGEGAVFELYIPAAGAPVAAAVAPSAVPTRGRGQRVLFVDDEAALLSSYCALIRGLGYEVSPHSDPEEALRAFRGNPAGFDCCLTDYSMRGLNGIQLAAALRGIRPGFPIAMASGYGVDLDLVPATGAGIQERLSKPYSLVDLAATLERLLAGPAREVLVPLAPSAPSRQGWPSAT